MLIVRCLRCRRSEPGVHAHAVPGCASAAASVRARPGPVAPAYIHQCIMLQRQVPAFHPDLYACRQASFQAWVGSRECQYRRSTDGRWSSLSGGVEVPSGCEMPLYASRECAQRGECMHVGNLHMESIQLATTDVVQREEMRTRAAKTRCAG
jgi:hypothetical protein